MFYSCLSVHKGVGFPACITGHMTGRSVLEGGLHQGLYPRGGSASRRRQGEVSALGGGGLPNPQPINIQAGVRVLRECFLVVLKNNFDT